MLGGDKSKKVELPLDWGDFNEPSLPKAKVIFARTPIYFILPLSLLHKIRLHFPLLTLLVQFSTFSHIFAAHPLYQF